MSTPSEMIARVTSTSERRSRTFTRTAWAALLLGVLTAAPLAGQVRRDVSQADARHSPAWLSDGVLYELNVRTFSPEGTFDAVTARLGDLKALGVNIIWLMPINPIGQLKKKGSIGSPYAVRDYYGINPDYGTADDLHRLVNEAHGLGLKVIVDVVLDHTSWDNELMKRPAFYKHDAAGNPASPYDWTDVVQLDYANPEVRSYMTKVLEYWIREFDLDGFRCDVASMVPTDFWEQARKDLEAIKPDIMMLAEAQEPELLAKAFDIDYSWTEYHALSDAATGAGSAREIQAAWEAERKAGPRGALHMRIADDHDEQRAIALFGVHGALAASAVIFTMDGVPLLYNGMEVGDDTESTAPALFEKLPVFWAIAERRPEVPRFYHWMIPLRHAHAALRQGKTTWVRNSDEDRVLTYVRSDSTEEILVAINLSNRPFRGTVEVMGEGFTELTPTGETPAPAALPALFLDAWGVRVFRRPR
jgi:cyclomaltodextrinase